MTGWIGGGHGEVGVVAEWLHQSNHKNGDMARLPIYGCTIRLSRVEHIVPDIQFILEQKVLTKYGRLSSFTVLNVLILNQRS